MAGWKWKEKREKVEKAAKQICRPSLCPVLYCPFSQSVFVVRCCQLFGSNSVCSVVFSCCCCSSDVLSGSICNLNLITADQRTASTATTAVAALDKWALCSVSFSAQIFSLPRSFHSVFLSSNAEHRRTQPSSNWLKSRELSFCFNSSKRATSSSSSPSSSSPFSLLP